MPTNSGEQRQINDTNTITTTKNKRIQKSTIRRQIQNDKVNHNRNTTIKQKTQRTIMEYIETSKSRTEIEQSNQWGDHHQKKVGCRLLFNNINGLSPSYNFAKGHIIAMQTINLNADIVGMAETNLDWSRGKIKDTVKYLFAKYIKQPKLETSSSTLSIGSNYQPGGTACVVAHPWSNKCRTTFDKTGLGRWTEVELTGKRNTKVTIITAYIVCNSNVATAGVKTAFYQQWHILKNASISDNPDPKAQCMKDLGKRIQELQDDHQEVIIMMDANDTTMKPNSKLSKWVRELNLVDIHVYYHGTDDEPHTYSRGSTRIDYILATPNISEYVSACGIMPLHELCISDHRTLFADFDLEAYLGGNNHRLQPKSNRGVSGKDPRKITMYIHALTEKLNASSIESTLLELSAENILDISQRKRLEEIDREFTTMRLQSEKITARKNESPWSVVFKIAYSNHIFWNTWMSQIKLKIDLSSALSRVSTDETKQYIHKIEPCDDIKQFVNIQLKESKKRLENVREHALELREAFLLEQAEMYNSTGNKDKAKAIQQQRNKEASGRMWAKLGRIMKPTKRSNLECLLIKDDTDTLVRTYDSEKIETILTDRNEKHFSQADGTPFTVPPLSTALGDFATNSFSDSILEGSVDLNSLELDTATKAFIESLKRPPIVEEIEWEITFNQLIQSYKKWKEGTSTSPSGIHLGHEKAVLQLQKMQESLVKDTTLDPLYIRVFKIKAMIINLALKHNHYYQRWAYVVNTMIEKIPGQPLPDKFRVIHLLESDFNSVIGTLWGRRLLYSGEDNNMFDDGQGGSRSDRRAQELLIQKHLTYSIWRMTHHTGASFDNDAKSCFDRIVMTVASLCSQQIGMPKKACELFLNTLRHMKYHVKTAYGVSEQFYCTNSEHTIHGPGQGGRGSPCVWLIISSALMKCMKSVNKGSTIIDPNNKNDIFTQAITGFVDDITHWYSTTSTEDNESVINHLQQTAQWWEQLLHATGGKLELTKCFYYLVEWKFDSNGLEHMVLQNNNDGTPANIDTCEALLNRNEQRENNIRLIDSETKDQITIPRKSCDEFHKTLGVFETPNGDYSEEHKRLYNKSRGFAQRVATTSLTPREAKALYFQMYLPSMNYSAVIGTLNEDKANKIQAAATKQCLARMGFNRCLPNPVVYGSRTIGGVGLHHLFAEQGSIKSAFIIRMIRCNRPASEIILRQLKWAQRCAGIKESILIDTSTYIPQLQKEAWLNTLREFLNKSQATIYINGLNTNELQCKHDRYIMDVVLSLKLSNKTICNINRCRYYLQASTISDLVDAEGTHISTEAYHLEEHAIIDSPGSWPHQPIMGKELKRDWKNFILQLCYNDTLLLEQPLGSWTVQNIRMQKGNTAQYNERNKTAMIKTEQGWQTCTLEKLRRYQKASWEQSIPAIPSATHIPASSKLVSHHQAHLKWRDRILPDAENIDDNQTWESYTNNLTIIDKHLIQGAIIRENIDILRNYLQSNTLATIVSDGGHKNGQGTFAWILHCNDTILIECKGTAFGTPMSSHRAECIGKLSWITYIIHLQQFYNLQLSCRLQSFCDNKAVILQTKSNESHIKVANAMIPNYDIINDIMIKQKILMTLATRMTHTEHVKGHQKITANSSIQQILNEKVDKMATECLENFHSLPHIKNTVLPSCKAYLFIDDKPVSSNEMNLLQWRWAEFNLQEYYSKRWNLTNTELHTINWAGLKLGRNRLTESQQTFAIKQSIGWLPTGNLLQKYGNIITTCPLCSEYEDEDHILLCHKRQGKIQEAILKFREYMKKINTAPILQDTLHIGINNWIIETKITVVDENIKKLLNAQGKIGWNKLMQGIITNEFAMVQENHCMQNNKNTLGDSWSGKISAFWLKEVYDIWKERCEQIHDLEKEGSREEEEILAQVAALYDLEPLLTHQDKVILGMPLERRLMIPVNTLKLWLNNTRPLLQECITVCTSEITRTNRSIREYFNPNSQDQIGEINPDINTNAPIDTTATQETPTGNNEEENCILDITEPIILQEFNAETEVSEPYETEREILPRYDKDSYKDTRRTSQRIKLNQKPSGSTLVVTNS